MIDPYKLKVWLSWPLIRAHLCTLAVAVSFNSWWHVPRNAFRFGGLSYGLLLTVAMTTIALPAILLQLAVGQLSQQDTAGVWRAVPFFKGVGYLRLLISFVSAVYTVVYIALTITYFLYTLSNSIPFIECTELVVTDDGSENIINSTTCLNETFMAPVKEQPEYYIAVALIIVVLWVTFPFVLYNPVKLMKRIFYVLGPLVLILAVVIISCIGQGANILSIQKSNDWHNMGEPYIWVGAATQALISSQVSGGYLISAADSIYANTNIQWTTMAFVGANVVASWVGLLFWFGLSGADDKDISPVAVLVETYRAADEENYSIAWPLLIFITLVFSGIITMLTLLYPLYDRFRRVCGPKWRMVSAGSSLVGAGAALAALAGRLPALIVLDDYVIPFLASFTTVLEILAFVFIYGWKILVEDVEFLTGRELKRYWVMGWCMVPSLIVPFVIWWLVVIFISNDDWKEPPWKGSAIVSAAALATIIIIITAILAVARQVQYDLIGKLKSSFQPSRHWGPRDPITHYYWLARREEADRGNLPRTRYRRRQLGQLSGRPSFLNVADAENNATKSIEDMIADVKRRTNSDDWLYTGYRKQCLTDLFQDYYVENRARSKSLDWALTGNVSSKKNRPVFIPKQIESAIIISSESENSLHGIINSAVKSVNKKITIVP